MKLVLNIELDEEEHRVLTKAWIQYVSEQPESGFNTLEDFLSWSAEISFEDATEYYIKEEGF
jgi:hypothetical protein